MLIQHYDAAYSAPDYRIAQAEWLQRQLHRNHLPGRILPGVSGLHITLEPSGVRDWDIRLDSPSAPHISSYLNITDDLPE